MQIMLVVYGSGSIVVGSAGRDLALGDVVIVRPGVIHEFCDAHALQLIVCRFSPFGIRAGLERSLDQRATSILLSARPFQTMRVSSDRFRALASALGTPTQGGEMGNLGRLLLVLEALSDAGTPQPPIVHSAVSRSIQAFDGDLVADWELPSLAARFDLDPSYLARVFKTSVGASPVQYLAMMKAEAAAELLGETRLPCSAIAEKVGWKDPNYFSRRFRQHFGYSPTEYRGGGKGAEGA
jgi:AraC family L-rhamnose operon transcriptional activator RhaR